MSITSEFLVDRFGNCVADGAVNGFSGIRSCFDHVTSEHGDEEALKFAELVKNAIETPSSKSVLIRMDSDNN